MKNYLIKIDGMGCAHCVKSVSEALAAIGAKVEECAIGSARIAFGGDEAAVREAIEERGFTVVSLDVQ